MENQQALAAWSKARGSLDTKGKSPRAVMSASELPNKINSQISSLSSILDTNPGNFWREYTRLVYSLH